MLKHTVLIAEDDLDLAHVLSRQFHSLGYNVFRSPDALHALLGVHRIKPSLIVMDLNMPGGNGLSVCEMLASDRETSHIPVIMISGYASAEMVQRTKLAGARFVPKGTNLLRELAVAVSQSVGDEPQTAGSHELRLPASALPTQSQPEIEDCPAKRPKIMAIDDDPDVSEVLKRRLEPYGVDVLRAFSGMQGFWSCLDARPDVIISDLRMTDGDGSYILHRLRAHALTQKTPVIILTGQTNPAIRRDLLSQGADAFLYKPMVFSELLKVLQKLIQLPPFPSAGP
jgi:CheY-like chemotaxis protein